MQGGRVRDLRFGEVLVVFADGDVKTLAGHDPLRLSGLVIGGWLMARSALAASRLLGTADGADAAFFQEKIATACFYAGQLLPLAAGLLPAVTVGAEPLFRIDLSASPARV